MKKIGFIDYYLSEWHANNYPAWIEASCRDSGLNYQVAYAYAKLDKSPIDNVTSEQWCKKFNVQKCETVKELIEKSDCIIVLAPSNPELHEQLALEALKSKKPLYIDKTFADCSAAAIRMFDLAAEGKTPMYSSSALRFADELKAFREGESANSAFVVGGGKFEEYCIHVFEILVTVMGAGAQRIKCVLSGDTKTFAVEYADARRAQTLHCGCDNAPFAVCTDGKHSGYMAINSDFFRKFVDEMLNFFESGTPIVAKEQTIEVAKLIDAAKQALKKPSEWVNI